MFWFSMTMQGVCVKACMGGPLDLLCSALVGAASAVTDVVNHIVPHCTQLTEYPAAGCMCVPPYSSAAASHARSMLVFLE